MILYQYPGAEGIASVSPPCLKVWLALRRLGAEHRVVECKPSETRRVSMTGRLPVLELEDGKRVQDSLAILDYLEERFPEADLFLRDPVARARDRLWEHYGTDVLYWYGFYFRWHHPVMAPKTFDAFFRRMSPLARIVVRLTFARRARRRGYLHGIGGLPAETVERATARGFATLETGLQGGPFLQSRRKPGRGDLACVGLLAQVGFRDTLPEIESRFREHPALRGYVAAVFEACGAKPPEWLGKRP